MEDGYEICVLAYSLRKQNDYEKTAIYRRKFTRMTKPEISLFMAEFYKYQIKSIDKPLVNMRAAVFTESAISIENKIIKSPIKIDKIIDITIIKGLSEIPHYQSISSFTCSPLTKPYLIWPDFYVYKYAIENYRDKDLIEETLRIGYIPQKSTRKNIVICSSCKLAFPIYIGRCINVKCIRYNNI